MENKRGYATTLAQRRLSRKSEQISKREMSLHNVGSSDDVSGRVSYNRSCWERIQDPAHSRGRRIRLLQILTLAFLPMLSIIVQTWTTFHDISVLRQDVTRIDARVISLIENQTDILNKWKEMYNASSELVSMYMLLKAFSLDSHFIPNSMLLTTDVTELPGTGSRSLIAYNNIDESGLWRYLYVSSKVSQIMELFFAMSVVGMLSCTDEGSDFIHFFQDLNYDAFVVDQLERELLHLPIKKGWPELMRLWAKREKFRNMITIEEWLRSTSNRTMDLSEYMNWTDSFFDALSRVLTEHIYLTEKQIESILRDARMKEAIAIGIVVMIVIISPIIIILILMAVGTIQAYAKDLTHKAAELKEERKKSDYLLFRMLPPSVAQQLKQTQQIPAEYYEAVTIYFSDIVGFTEFAAENPPLQVVIFLNSIYELFDTRIECYDVYKIETIGDSYMVASGLPVKNDDRHVPEIATMALDLLDISSGWEVPERSSKYLHIRSGIHTGPVMAGIIGRKMPRYCLFGDTVNTASRMESTGEALRIQISWEMKEALDTVGGFQMSHRGLVDIKGKGPMNTYWLEGKRGGIMRAEELDLSTFCLNKPPPFMQQLRNEESIA